MQYSTKCTKADGTNVDLFLQKDLSNLADQLSFCQNPLQFPKTVIFVKIKSVAVKVFAYLHRSAHLKGMVSMCHAKLSTETKEYIHHQFSSHTSSLRCLCATVAFGLVSLALIQLLQSSHKVSLEFYHYTMQGMDIADIKLVIVYGLPTTMAMLYQVYIQQYLHL